MTDTPENNNPFNKSQRTGQPHTIKWCAWEILKTEGIATEERLAEIITERSLRNEIKATSIAKELGSDKYRFASSPEGWSIIPSFDDFPTTAPSRRNPLPTVAAAAAPSPVKRKKPPEANLDDSGDGRRRTKSSSEWWKVEKPEGEQQDGLGGHGNAAAAAAGLPEDDEDEEIDIMTGAVPPIKIGRTLLNHDSIRQKEKITEENKKTEEDAGNGNASISRAQGVAMDFEIEKKPAAPGVQPIKKESPEGPANSVKVEPAVEVAEKPQNTAAGDNKLKRKKNFLLPATAAKETTEPIHPVESQPNAVSPAPKGFIIPKRRSSAGAPAPAPAPAGGSKDASANRNNKTSNGTKDNGDLRRLSTVPTNADLTTTGRPPLPLRKQPWQNMLQDIHGAFASAWNRLNWPRSVATPTSLPQPINPDAITEEQKTAWGQARSRFGARTAVSLPPQPPQPQQLSTTATRDAADSGTANKNETLILHQLTQDPYPPHPPDLIHIRIMQCPTGVVQQCLDRMVFASNHRADTDGIQPGQSLIVLHDFDKRILYGCYRAVEVGRMLDTRFAEDRSFHVRVEPVQVFSPLPSYLLEGFLPRKYDKNGEPMKFFEKGTGLVKEVWHLMQLYSNKGFKC